MRYEKDGFDPIETSLPAEGVRLRAEGWRPVTNATPAYDRPGGYSEGGEFDSGGTLPAGLNKVHNKLGKPEPLVRETSTETPDDPEAETPKRRRSK